MVPGFGEVWWECGIGVGSPSLPGSVNAEMVFSVEYDDDGDAYPDESDFNVALTDESGAPITFDPRLLPLIRFAIIEHMSKPGKNGQRSQMALMEERAAEQSADLSVHPYDRHAA